MPLKASIAQVILAVMTKFFESVSISTSEFGIVRRSILRGSRQIPSVACLVVLCSLLAVLEGVVEIICRSPRETRRSTCRKDQIYGQVATQSLETAKIVMAKVCDKVFFFASEWHLIGLP